MEYWKADRDEESVLQAATLPAHIACWVMVIKINNIAQAAINQEESCE